MKLIPVGLVHVFRVFRAFSVLCLFVHLISAQTASANQARAKSVYKTCAPCHGNKAEGKPEVAAPAIAGLPEWYILVQLKKFRDGTRGKHPKDEAGMRMRPLSRTLTTEEDVAAIATYVASMPKQEVTRTVFGNVVKGEESYQVCSSCHGPDAAGNKDLNAPPLRGMNDWYLLTQLKNFKHKIRGGDPVADPIGASMAPMAGILDDEGMKNVVTYINALK